MRGRRTVRVPAAGGAPDGRRVPVPSTPRGAAAVPPNGAQRAPDPSSKPAHTMFAVHLDYCTVLATLADSQPLTLSVFR